MMYFKAGILCLFNFVFVNGLDLIGLNDGYINLVREIQAIAVLVGAPIYTRWIEQKVDHFDSSDTRTWKMRYFERTDFWRTNGPVYLFIGGEAPGEPGFLTTGVMYELAKETKGAMFISEHRYYGKSQPVKGRSVQDMQYLTVKQALEDLANLLRKIDDNPKYKNSKTVVIGGSYAGNLAAWMEVAYPDLVDATIASSAPVLAKRDFFEYLEVVNNDYAKYGTVGCLENIRKIFQRYDTLFKTAEGQKEIKKEENICEESDLNKPENKQLFFLIKASPFMSTAQYGTIEEIQDHCSNLNGKKSSITLDDLLDFLSLLQGCYNFDYDRLIEEYRKEENDWAYCWTYQTCTELGYSQTTNSNNQPFTNNIPLEFYDKVCKSLFGAGFDQNQVNNGVNAINNRYGGKSPTVTGVIFSNGELDPWSSLGVLTNISDDSPAVYIAKSSHCRDLFSTESNDPQELKDARVLIKLLVKQQIGAN